MGLDPSSWTHETLDPENGHLVVMKNYPPKFKADGVALGHVRWSGVSTATR